jgi:uncharacterized repeat protein (TIGR03803 family)
MNAQQAVHARKQAEPAATQTYTETIVHQFAHYGGDGSQPPYGLVSDSSGNLYGVTNAGGSGEQGALFELTPNGNGSMTYNFLDSLGGGPTFITTDNQGNLYLVLGIATGGVVELSKGANGSWIESNAYGFTGALDGADPSMVVPDGAGNVYSSTISFFELQAADDQWLFQPLVQGVSADALLMDENGGFYGTSFYGGSEGSGFFLKLDNGKNGWAGKVLYNFQGGANDGGGPTGTLTFGPDGDIYGVAAYYGHQQNSYLCCGGVYKITKSGELTWLYLFTGGADGIYPTTGVIFDKLGNLYGVTAEGGSFSNQPCGFGCGVVYKLTPPAGNPDGPWTESVLYSFSGGTDGYQPVGPLALDSAGNLYGVTAGGGDGYGIGGDGVVFELTPNAVPTSVNITKSYPNPSLTGQVVTVSFTVAQTVAGINPPTGTVTVNATTGESCFEPLAANGKGSCQLLLASAGTRTLTVSYSGDAGNQSSVSAGVSQAVLNLTTTKITKNHPETAKVGQLVTVHFSVEPIEATKHTTEPSGSVTVTSSTGESCTGMLSQWDHNGNCQLTFSAAGSRTLTAMYAGDANNAGSVSVAVTETVE